MISRRVAVNCLSSQGMKRTGFRNFSCYEKSCELSKKTLDNLPKLCYNNIIKGKENPSNQKGQKIMMNAAEMKNVARAATLNLFADTLAANDAVQFGDASFAILQTVDGQEIWTEVTVKTKAYKATKVNPAFDPFVAAENWKEDKRIKAEKAAEKAAKKDA